MPNIRVIYFIAEIDFQLRVKPIHTRDRYFHWRVGSESEQSYFWQWYFYSLHASNDSSKRNSWLIRSSTAVPIVFANWSPSPPRSTYIVDRRIAMRRVDPDWSRRRRLAVLSPSRVLFISFYCTLPFVNPTTSASDKWLHALVRVTWKSRMWLLSFWLACQYVVTSN